MWATLFHAGFVVKIFTSISIAISESVAVASVESPIVHPTHSRQVPTRAARWVVGGKSEQRKIIL